MNNTENAFTFTNDGQNELIGIIHSPDHTTHRVGLLIIVGGPQYRIGPHRQYVHMARYCAAHGIATMRFDYQGIGDSDGKTQGFEHVSSDIDSAIEEFLSKVPEIKSIAIWGMCEGASSILLGATKNKAVSHIILANPWVRSEAGLAKAYVKHYYWNKLKSPEFWKKIFSGRLNLTSALAGFVANLKKAFVKQTNEDHSSSISEMEIKPFPDRMLSSLMDFKGKTLLILSEHDLVAREFDDLIKADKIWRNITAENILKRIDLKDSDHTFSTEKWRTEVAKNTANWLLAEKDE